MKYLPLLLTMLLLPGLCAGCGVKRAGIKPDNQALFNTVCPADEALEKARAAGIPVMEDLRCTAGQAAMETFYETVSAGKKAQLVCLSYYTLDSRFMAEESYEERKDQYPQASFILVTFDGKTYTVTERLSSDIEPEYRSSFPCLVHLTGNAPSQASYSTYDTYVLADDPSITMERIWESWLSSDSQVAFGCPHYIIFNHYAD